MDVEIGSNLSYVCRSLLTARDLNKEGSKLQVGDGRYIKVSTHKWLTHNPIFWGEVQSNLLVKDLIHDDTGQCDRDKVFDLFAHKTCMEILLPICFGNFLLHKMFGPFNCQGKFQKCSNVTQDIFMLFRWQTDKPTQQELERWAVTAWVIWNAQNKYYFEHVQTYPKSILNGALGSLLEYQHLIAAQSSN